MKNEKEIVLNSEEILQLLEGALYWKDIESKIEPQTADLKTRLNLNNDDDGESNLEEKDLKNKYQGENKEVSNISEESAEDSELPDNKLRMSEGPAAKEYGIQDENCNQEDDLRAILFGREEEQKQEPNIPESETVVKDRQIDFSRLQNELEWPVLGQAAAADDFDPGLFQRDGAEDDDDDLFYDEETEQKKPFLRGWRLLILMAVVAGLTFGIWYYFLLID